MNPILQEDIEGFRLPEDILEALRGATVVVTGATGLVGGSFVRYLAGRSIGVKFILPVRDIRKADALRQLDGAQVTPVGTELTGFFNRSDFKCDYIVHCASPTNGRFMQEHPAETYLLAVESTKAILEYARRVPVKGVLYVSSIEYYGQNNDDSPISEESMGFVDRKSARNSYALGKQAAEYLSFCYAAEYGVPVMSARLTQTFGAGISAEDNRVFAQFARSVMAGEDIVLHTAGNSAKPYVYISDCVAAMCCILVKGKAGEAYNVATPGSYLSIGDFARLFTTVCPGGPKVVTKLDDTRGYAPETRINLDPSRLLSLGWRPRYPLPEMIKRLIAYLKTSDTNGE